MTGAAEALRLARDVPGVVGSFLLDGDGRVLARDLPDSVGDDVVATIGRRCRAAIEAIDLPLPGSEQVLLRFERLAVVTVRVDGALLVVLAESAAQASVVRIATRATAARLVSASRPGERDVVPGEGLEARR